MQGPLLVEKSPARRTLELLGKSVEHPPDGAACSHGNHRECSFPAACDTV